MRLGLVYTQTLHEPAVLLGCQCPGLTFLPWPLEAAGLQTFIQQDKSVSLPVQGLDPVSPSAAEEEERVAERVQFHLLLDQCGKTVDPTAQVGVAAFDVNVVGTTKIVQHDFNTRSTASTVAASAPE